MPRAIDARRAMHLRMTEAEMQKAITDTAKRHGWRVHHDPPVLSVVTRDGSTRYRTAIAGDPGFPDLVLARDGVTIIVECKREVGAKWKPGQREWLAALGARVVIPSTMDSLLRRLATSRVVPPAANGTS